MGSIASVLQWHCSQCKHINPTEVASCSECGAERTFHKFQDHQNLPEDSLKEEAGAAAVTALRPNYHKSLERGGSDGGNEGRSSEETEPSSSQSSQSSTSAGVEGGSHHPLGLASFECHLEEPKIAEW